MRIKDLLKQLPLLIVFTMLLSLTACGDGDGDIDIDDSNFPTITSFTLPAASSSLIVDITSFVTNDNVGVTGYCLDETNSSSGCTWNNSAPSYYTFTTAGSKTLYAFAKDAAGNISNSVNASTTITISDTSAPTVTILTLPATSNSLDVAVSSFTASDNVGVTGYCLVESDNSNGCTWSVLEPTSYLFTSAGSKTLYAFAKDAAGNISNSMSSPISLVITAQVTIGIQRIDNTQGSNVGSVDLDITLPTDFFLETTANIPTTMTAIVAGLNVQEGVNYTHPTLTFSLMKGDGTAFSTGNLVSFSRTLQSDETLPTAESFQLDLNEVSEISGNNVTIQTQDYETTLTIEEI